VLAPQVCRCTNLQVDPEVWFRIVHLAKVGNPGAPVAIYREQMVGIAFGPKGAFENGNIGALRLREPLGRRMSAAPPSRGGRRNMSAAPWYIHRPLASPGVASATALSRRT